MSGESWRPVAGFVFMKQNNLYKLFLFVGTLIVTGILSRGNWTVAFMVAIVLLSIFEVEWAYQKGKKDGYEKCRRQYER